jgi:hypothetical protein
MLRKECSAWEVTMHCPYCGVDYSESENCLCLPPVRAGKIELAPQPAGPWGEADREWSLRKEDVASPAPFINLV